MDILKNNTSQMIILILKPLATHPRSGKSRSYLLFAQRDAFVADLPRRENTSDVRTSNDKFLALLKPLVPIPDYHLLKGKKHIPMITQFLWSWNPHYEEIINFMNNNSGDREIGIFWSQI